MRFLARERETVGRGGHSDESLAARLTRARARGEPLDIENVIELGLRLADVLEAAQAEGIQIHLAPHDIRLLDGSLRRPELDLQAASEAAMFEGAPSGLFSLGAVLFCCLTLREPSEGHRISKYRPDVPPELDLLVEHLLERTPNARPSSVLEVKLALQRIGARLLDVAATPAEPSPPRGHGPTRLTVAWSVLAAVAACALTFARWHRTPAETAPVAPAVDTSVAATCDPRAAAMVSEAVRWMHESRWLDALRLLDEAERIDGACPQVLFRRFEISHNEVPISENRQRYRAAMRVRDALSPRDQLVLDAFGAQLVPEPSQQADALRILERAIKQFPNDSEIAMLWAMQKMQVARTRSEVEEALAATKRVTEIDPTATDPWQVMAKALLPLHRFDEGLAALDHCLALAPNSSDCANARIELLMQSGRCEEALAAARARAASAPQEPHFAWDLANTLTETGAPAEDIDEAIRIYASHQSEDRRARALLFHHAQRLAHSGDFQAELRTLDELDGLLARSGDREEHLGAAMLAADALLEIGNLEHAGRVADAALVRKDAWVHNNENPVEGMQWEPWLLAARLRAGRSDAATWRKDVAAWSLKNAVWLNDFELWGLGWGAALGTSIPASEILSHMPAGEPVAAVRLFRPVWGIAWLQAHSGRAYLEAGDAATARPLLETGARACYGLEAPFLDARTRLWLGIARERMGNIQEACDAYRFVIDAWGHAKPTSVTAREAERRSHALACKF